jgi:uncharacterized protein (TIGR02231 family)
MKKMLFFLLTLAQLTPSVFYAQNDKTVKTTVQRATIFQQGVLLSSTELVAIGSGTTNIIFENVSPYLQQNSLQAAGKNDLVIMDIQYRLKYAEQTKTDVKPDDPKVIRWKDELKTAQDSLDDLNFVKKDIQNRIGTLQTERSVLVNNRMMRGDLQRDSLALFMQSIDFLRKRQNDIDSELLKLEKESFKESRLRTQLNTRIATLNSLIQGIGTPTNNSPTKPMPQVIVTVMSERATAAEITLTYFVQQAGWAASYDLRASKENQNIDLKHRASVYQNTGIDWKDVLLTLSTGDPNQGNTKPILTPQYLAYNMPIQNYRAAAKMKQPMPQVYQNNMATNAPVADMEKKEQLDEVVVAGEDRDGVADFTQIHENMMRIEYEIKLKYSIESDNKAHNVVIQSKTIPAVYSYSVVPKLDPDAFLMARVTDWEDMNLIPGAARIYFDNSYIGESYINPRNTNDTLQLNLGRDKSIVVTRTKVKDKCKDKVLSDNHLLTQVYDITVRNTKNSPIRIVIEDQMPVTKEQDIKIEYLENSGARFNPETGKLVWDFNLKSKDSKKLTFSYEVKSPKDRALSSL